MVYSVNELMNPYPFAVARQMANKWHPQNGLTLYGRKPALEALANRALEIAQLHLADSNRPGGIIAQIIAQAEARGIPIRVS